MKKLEIKDKKIFDEFFLTHTTYSDFNFTSLYTWDLENKCEYGFINENLTIRFQDYLTRIPFFSYLGSNKVTATVDYLVTSAEKEHIDTKLKMVPEVSLYGAVDKLEKNYSIVEDRDNFDYVYYLPDIAQLSGNKYYNQRNLVNRFKRKYPEYKILNLNMRDKQILKEIDDLFVLWGSRKVDKEHINDEHECFRRLFLLCDQYDYHALGIYVKDTLIAFAINELLSFGFALAHYRKADVEYAGVYKVLEQESAKQLCDLGFKYLNYEQDIGLPELRQSKRSWSDPNFYLKKYTISKYFE